MCTRSFPSSKIIPYGKMLDISAARMDHPDEEAVLTRIVNCPWILFEETDVAGHTIVHWAAKVGEPKVMEWLLHVLATRRSASLVISGDSTGAVEWMRRERRWRFARRFELWCRLCWRRCAALGVFFMLLVPGRLAGDAGALQRLLQ